ncbi:LCR-like protein [Medicago truncatula]|uniref:LCR-like protein n=1 Tax=Medicago truncatula TaxID=3880 RepID=A0A072V953_MEDTR|nr:LCR-like protein [Medicago truncatula]
MATHIHLLLFIFLILCFGSIMVVGDRCYPYERCASGSEFCNHFCTVTMGFSGGGYCEGNSKCCCIASIQ